MKSMKRLPILFFVLCTVALLVPYVYAASINTINATATNPGTNTRSFTATYNSTHSGGVSLSGSETGNYSGVHELKYPNQTVKHSANGVSGSLNVGNTRFNTSQSNSWTILTSDPAGTYTHRAYTSITVPGESKNVENNKTFSVN